MPRLIKIRIRCNDFKISRFGLVMRKKVFISVVKSWHRMSRGVADAALFEVCQDQAGRGFEQLDPVKEMTLTGWAGRLGCIFKDSFQPKPLYDI